MKRRSRPERTERFRNMKFESRKSRLQNLPRLFRPSLARLVEPADPLEDLSAKPSAQFFQHRSIEDSRTSRGNFRFDLRVDKREEERLVAV